MPRAAAVAAKPPRASEIGRTRSVTDVSPDSELVSTRRDELKFHGDGLPRSLRRSIACPTVGRHAFLTRWERRANLAAPFPCVQPSRQTADEDAPASGQSWPSAD